MTHLYLEQNVKSSDYGSFPGRVYLSVFDEAGQALHFSGAVYGLAPYVLVNAALHAKPIVGSAIRPGSYIADIPVSALSLPENAYGERYRAEWWKEAVSGTVNPTADKFISHEEFTWSGVRRVESRLDVTQEVRLAEMLGLKVFTQAKADSDATANSWGEYFSALKDSVSGAVWTALSGSVAVSGSFGDIVKQTFLKAINLPTEPAGVGYESFSSLSYSSSDRIATVMCWLEKDHALVAAASACRYILYDDAGTVIIDSTVPTPGSEGQFSFTRPDIDFSPDAVYFSKTIISDANGVPHASGASPVAWD